MRPTFDERDGQILAEREQALRVNMINVGDFVTFRDGVTRRVSHIWLDVDGEPESIQTSIDGSFYLGYGYVSFSGALYHGVPFESLADTGDMHDGHVWFFHHDYPCRDNGVHTTAKFRVWRCQEAASS